jgi:hypothetical protein
MSLNTGLTDKVVEYVLANAPETGLTADHVLPALEPEFPGVRREQVRRSLRWAACSGQLSMLESGRALGGKVRGGAPGYYGPPEKKIEAKPVSSIWDYAARAL